MSPEPRARRGPELLAAPQCYTWNLEDRAEGGSATLRSPDSEFPLLNSKRWSSNSKTRDPNPLPLVSLLASRSALLEVERKSGRGGQSELAGKHIWR